MSRIVVFLLAGGGILSCAGRPAPRPAAPPVPYLTAATDDLLEQLAALAQQAPSFSADGKLSIVRGGKSREVGMRLAVRKPTSLRLQGTKPLLPTLFVMVANPTGLWLDVPSRRKTYHKPAGLPVKATGELARALVAFDPTDFLRALVPDPPHPDEIWSLTAEPAAYQLQGFVCAGLELRPTRSLRFERRTLGLEELALYGPDGRLVSRTRFGVRPGGSALPGALVIERPFEEVRLKLDFDHVRAVSLPDGAFEPSLPKGRTLIDVTRAEPLLEELPLGEEPAR